MASQRSRHRILKRNCDSDLQEALRESSESSAMDISTETLTNISGQIDDYQSVDESFEIGMSCDSDSDISDATHTARSETDVDSLIIWSQEYNIPFVAVRALFRILRNKFNLDLPLSLNRCYPQPKDSVIFSDFSGGKFAYFGFEKLISKSKNSYDFTKCCGQMYRSIREKHGEETVTISLNIDGLSLFPTSNMNVWPILAVINEEMAPKPVPIGVYVGKKKPQANQFLSNLVEDIKNIHSTHPEIRVLNFICDAPARSMVKTTKSHTWYNACDYCTQKGVYKNGKVVYPYIRCSPRKDSDFVSYDKSFMHQLSPLAEVMPMVSAFSPEYMHLLCLGVMRKLLFRWCKRSPSSTNVRLLASARAALSEMIVRMSTSLPDDFKRKVRENLG